MEFEFYELCAMLGNYKHAAFSYEASDSYGELVRVGPTVVGIQFAS